MTQRWFLVVGEAVVDLIAAPGSWRFDAVCGGSPLNVAVGLAAAGHRTRLATQVGDDLFAGLVTEHLHRYGVDTAEVAADAPGTSLALARLDDTGTAAYDFRISWHWADHPALDAVTALHVGSLGTALAPGAAAVGDVVARARAQGVPVSYDPNIRPTLAGDCAAATVDAWVALADVVKVSDEDLAWLYPETPPYDVAAEWASAGPALVVLTRGAAGAVAWCGGRRPEVVAPTVPVVDTVGAGDAFTAGLLAGLAEAEALPRARPPDPATTTQALRRATAAATAVCQHRGATPPAAADVAALADRVTLRD